MAGAGGDNEDPLGVGMVVDDEAAIWRGRVEARRRRGDARAHAGETSLDMIMVHGSGFRVADVAIDGVRRRAETVLFARDLDPVVARQRRKAIQVVRFAAAMHPDEDRRLPPLG